MDSLSNFPQNLNSNPLILQYFLQQRQFFRQFYARQLAVMVAMNAMRSPQTPQTAAADEPSPPPVYQASNCCCCAQKNDQGVFAEDGTAATAIRQNQFGASHSAKVAAVPTLPHQQNFEGNLVIIFVFHFYFFQSEINFYTDFR